MTSLPPSPHRPSPDSGELIVPEDAFALVVESCSAPYGRSIIELRLDTQPQGWCRRWIRDAGRSLPPTPEFLSEPLEESGVTGQLRVWCEAAGHTHLLGTMLLGVIRRELRLLLRSGRLEASHDQLQAMMQATPLALYSLSLEGLVKSWNAAAETALGLTQGGVAGPAVPDPALGQAFASLRHSVLSGQHVGTQRFDRQLPDGEVQAFTLSAAPFSTSGQGVAGLVGVAQPLSAAEQRLSAAEQQRSLLESVLAFANDSVLITEAEPFSSPGPRILYANEAFTRTTGYTFEEVRGQTPRILQGPRSDRKVLDRIKAALHAWQPIEVELINYRKDGSEFWVELSIAPVADERGWYTHWISIQRDITDRKTNALQQERDRTQILELAARNVPLPTVLGQLVGTLNRAFPNHRAALALAPADGAGGREQGPELYPQDAGGSADRWGSAELARTLLGAPGASRLQVELATGVPAYGPVQPIRSAQGQRRGVLALLSDQPAPLGPDDHAQLEASAQLAALVIDRYDAQRDLEHQALHDPLTGLPNRALFGQNLHEMLRSATPPQLVAVALMDLDRFKQVNDTLGHSAGDQLLRQVAARLRSHLRPVDLLARMGGDEFLMSFPQLTTPEQVDRLAERLIAALEQPFLVAGQEVFVRPSIGFSLHPSGALTTEHLLQQADAAMYRAKRRGGGYSLYSPESASGRAAMALESGLNRALERQEFVLHYQPQFDVQTGTLMGVEALLRWQHPELGLVAPGEFIPLAEASGLIVPIGTWVLEQACLQAAAWSVDHPGLRMAVNLSARQFERNDLPDVIRRALEVSGLGPGQLELELTESMLMQTGEAGQALQQLKNLGVRLALDDFGTGFSNLAYLKDLPIDMLKIDQSFVRGVAEVGLHHSKAQALVSAIIALAHALDLSVTVEGVELTSQLDFLREQRCEQVQGYLLARPQPAEALSAWLGRHIGMEPAERPGPEQGGFRP